MTTQRISRLKLIFLALALAGCAVAPCGTAPPEDGPEAGLHELDDEPVTCGASCTPGSDAGCQPGQHCMQSGGYWQCK